MRGKVVLALALIGLLVVIGPANGCRLCGAHWCSCADARPPANSRSWQIERPALPPQPSYAPLPQPIPSMCSYCGGYNRGYAPYAPRNVEDDYNNLRGYYCRCSPRRRRYRYDDY